MSPVTRQPPYTSSPAMMFGDAEGLIIDKVLKKIRKKK